MTSAALESAENFPWRSVGVWMAAILALSQGINAFRAVADPLAFSAYMGLPVSEPREAGFVFVYALRAAFLGLFAAILIARNDIQTLKIFALAALLMPLGDAALTWRAGAPGVIVARHIAYVVYIGVTAFLLHRWSLRTV